MGLETSLVTETKSRDSINVIDYYALARTFVKNGPELCASVFLVRFVPDMLRLYISKSFQTLKYKSNESLTVKHSFLENVF